LSPIVVRVTLFAFLADLAEGQKEIRGAGETVGDVLLDVGRQYPSLGAKIMTGPAMVNPGLCIMINGREIDSPAGLNRPVTDGDCLTLLPVIAGGK
jgi:sulfur-carrier protein